MTVKELLYYNEEIPQTKMVFTIFAVSSCN